MPSDTTPMMTPEEEEAIRADVRALMAAETLTMKDIARACGVAYGTFSSWMGGTYQGRTHHVAAEARRGLDAHRTKARTRAMAPAAPGFVPTATAEMFLGGLEHAQHMAELVVITGGPGVGKTTAAREYRVRNPNVWLMTAEPVHATPRALLDDLADAVGIDARGMSGQRLSRAITIKLRGTGGLLIIDEAQHLTSQTLDQLRSLHDLAGLGIALLGNETVYARLEGGTRAAHYAQLFSRVGMRLTRVRPVQADVAALLDAWGVAGAAERALLKQIAAKPGALRGLTKVLRIAHMLAGAKGEPALTVALIRMAWSQYSSRDTIDDGAAREAA